MSDILPVLTFEGPRYLETTHQLAHEIVDALWRLQDQQRELIHQATRFSDLLSDRTGTPEEDLEEDACHEETPLLE